MMRALTLTQPWAGLVAGGIKLVENRSRRMIGNSFVGRRFAIHASREIDKAVYDRIVEIAPDVLRLDGVRPVVPCKRDWYRFSRITSAVIAVATLSGIVTDPEYVEPDQRRWFFGPVGYLISDVVALHEPIRCGGWQGFWTLPADVERAVVAQLAGAA